jgi:hypothetical protein
MLRIKPAIIICVLVAGCGSKSKTDSSSADVSAKDTAQETVSVPRQQMPAVVPFELIRQYPIIKDTAAFIDALRKSCQLEVYENAEQQRLQKISYYKKVKLHGSGKSYVLLEYDYAVGSGASFPWKYQVLFNEEGELVQQFSALHFRLLNVFPGKAPLLLTTVATSKGNGGHELYQFRGDTLENVYEGYYDYHFSTYDAHEDQAIFEPNELNVAASDDNKDGYKDLVFQGKLVLIKGLTDNGDWYDTNEKNGRRIEYSAANPFKKLPIKLVYLYDPVSGHFKEKEDYEKKYEAYR